MEEDIWTLLASLMPKGIEVNPKSEEEAEITDGKNKLNIVYDSDVNTYTLNGKTLHFSDDFDVVNTILVPYILQELDGVRRI